jgi:protoporphyrinogen oxidase
MDQSDIKVDGNGSRIAILGCGVTALTLAAKLAKDGFQITLIERYDRIGGNHISVNIGDFTFDIGTFLFSEDGEFFKRFPGIQRLYLPVRTKFGRINGSGGLDAYPFSISNYYRQSPFPSFVRDILDLLICKAVHFNKRDVPGYAKYYLGRRIYEKSGLKNYVEKFYGIPDSEIDLQFALKRMSPIGAASSFRNNFRKMIRKRKSGKKKGKHFLIRPKSGFAVIYDSLRKEMEKDGIEFRLGSKIEAITRLGNDFSIRILGKAEAFDRVISTIPIDEALNLIGQKQVIELPAQKLVSLFIKLDGRFNFTQEVFYNFMIEGLWKRLTVYSRLYGKAEDQEYFGVEVPAGPLKNPDIEFIYTSVMAHMMKYRLLEGAPTLIGWNLLENAYPIYTKDNGPEIIRHKKILSDFGIESTGRQGNFDYIPSADLAVEKAAGFLRASAAPRI